MKNSGGVSQTIKALAGFANLFVILCLSLFLPAGSLNFREAWVYLLAFFGPVLFITFYFLRRDPELIARRLKVGPGAEKRWNQKVIQSLASFSFISLFVVSGFDHRLGWSEIPTAIVALADVAVVCGLFIVFLVFKENSYSSALVEVIAGQKVVSTGPYAVVRHPMYSGALLLVLFTPPALGSWYALPFGLLLLGVIIARLLDEENVLLQSLPGYGEYCRKVHDRLIPRMW